MWYKTAQNGFGGGMLSPVELKIQQALVPVVNNAEEMPMEENDIIQNPIGESTELYEQRLWDTIVNRKDGILTEPQFPNEDEMKNSGQAVEADEARRLSPYHKNPEETTMEEQLEAVRQENVNADPAQSMSSTEDTRGGLLVRGEFPYASGKGWTGYEDLPSDRSWA